MIVLNFNKDINSYAKDFQKIFLEVLNLLIGGNILCPNCGKNVKYNTKYRRHPKKADGINIDIEIIQCKCSSCGKTHALIPDFLAPYRHYTSEVIENAISLDVKRSDCIADNSTIYRWKRQFKYRGEQAVAKFLLILMKLYQRTISVIRLKNLSLIEQLSLCLNELSAKKSSTIIGATNEFLTHANAGFI